MQKIRTVMHKTSFPSECSEPIFGIVNYTEVFENTPINQNMCDNLHVLCAQPTHSLCDNFQTIVKITSIETPQCDLFLMLDLQK